MSESEDTYDDGYTDGLLDGASAERAAIVKWLNEDPQGWQWNGLLASRIERGVHLRGVDE